MIERPEELAVALITVKREPILIHQTLASLFASDRGTHRLQSVNLYVGSNESAYLDGYRHHEKLTIHRMDDDEWDAIKDESIWTRLCHNMRRALVMPESAKGLIFLEDDVLFMDRFLTTLIATINELEEAIGAEPYVLAGYIPYDFGRRPEVRRGGRYTIYPCEKFYGTQCIYYPLQVIDRLVEYFDRYTRGVESKPADMIVKQVGIDLRDGAGKTEGIYACHRSIAQHVGQVTTGVGTFHQSPTF